MKHTDEEIEEAARRFETLADELDPETATVEDLADLRAIGEAAGASDSVYPPRRGEAARGTGRQGWW